MKKAKSYALFTLLLALLLSGFALSRAVNAAPAEQSGDGYQLQAAPVLDDETGETAGIGLTTIKTGTGAGTQFQYWILGGVAASQGEEMRPVWELARKFDTDPDSLIDLTQENAGRFLHGGEYRFIVRINDGGAVTELYATYTEEQLGILKVYSVSVDGRQYIEDTVTLSAADSAVVTADVGGASEETVYTLLCAGEELVPSSGTAQFTLSPEVLDGLKAGVNVFTVEATDGVKRASKDFRVNVIKEYKAEERIIITSITGASTTEGEFAGKTDFVMNIRMADADMPLTAAVAEAADFSLTVENIAGAVTNYEPIFADGGQIVTGVRFKDVQLPGYGIYYVIGRAFVDYSASESDAFITYYGMGKAPGTYARQAGISFTVTGADKNADGSYTARTGIPLSITVDNTSYIRSGFSGGSNVDSGTLRAAFYREDAAGWVKVRTYRGLEEAYTAQFSRKGTYTLQLRLMQQGQGSYEGVTSVRFNVEDKIPGTGLDKDNLSFIITDNASTPSAVSKLYAGGVYILNAAYTPEGDETTLYRFVMVSENLGLTYLTGFTPSGRAVFVPTRPGRITVTVRVIATDSFGYMDVYEAKEDLEVEIRHEVAVTADKESIEPQYLGAQEQVNVSVKINGAAVADAAIVWESTQPAVCTVSASGLITAVGVGEAEVHAVYTSKGKDYIATVAVTVCDYMKKGDWTFRNWNNSADQAQTGIIADVAEGYALRYNQPINFTGKTQAAADQFIQLRNIPSKPHSVTGNYNIANLDNEIIYVRLTDYKDPTNYVTITIRPEKNEGAPTISNVAYAVAGAYNQVPAGINVGATGSELKETTPIFYGHDAIAGSSTLYGWALPTGYAHPQYFMGLTFNYADRALYSFCSGVGVPRLILDLDTQLTVSNPYYYQTEGSVANNPWTKGFTDGKAYVTVYAGGYHHDNTDTVKLFLRAINGIETTALNYSDFSIIKMA